MKVNLDTYIISDTHFGHKNIIKYCDRPEDHNQIMLKNWWRTISIDDTVLHLGDVMFNDYWLEEIKLLPGKKYLIAGNHDHRKELKKLSDYFEIIEPFTEKIKDKTIRFSHYPLPYVSKHVDINIHGHIHNNGYSEEEKTNGVRYINVSVEMMDYTPVKLRDILKEV